MGKAREWVRKEGKVWDGEGKEGRDWVSKRRDGVGLDREGKGKNG